MVKETFFFNFFNLKYFQKKFKLLIIIIRFFRDATCFVNQYRNTVFNNQHHSVIFRTSD